MCGREDYCTILSFLGRIFFESLISKSLVSGISFRLAIIRGVYIKDIYDI